jgi:hypothetical protein
MLDYLVMQAVEAKRGSCSVFTGDDTTRGKKPKAIQKVPLGGGVKGGGTSVFFAPDSLETQ